MSVHQMTPKQRARALIESMPETASWDDLVREMCFRKPAAASAEVEEDGAGDPVQSQEVRAFLLSWSSSRLGQ